MPDKQLTPIQEALKECDRLASQVAQTGDGLRICREMQKKLKELLPTEKQFAKDVWDASAAYQCYSDGPCSEYAPDFDELYKNYSNE